VTPRRVVLGVWGVFNTRHWKLHHQPMKHDIANIHVWMGGGVRTRKGGGGGVGVLHQGNLQKYARQQDVEGGCLRGSVSVRDTAGGASC
jgi:hypothetical protein